MYARDRGNGFYPSFTIRIFMVYHPTPSCGVSVASHGPGSWEIVLLHNYLQYIHFLVIQYTNKRVFDILFCVSESRSL